MMSGSTHAKKKPIAKLIWNEAYWANRAEEARAIQQEIRNSKRRRIMGEIADSDDRLAVLTRKFQTTAMATVPTLHQGEGEAQPRDPRRHAGRVPGYAEHQSGSTS
jgi:hypothetical protein